MAIEPAVGLGRIQAVGWDGNGDCLQSEARLETLLPGSHKTTCRLFGVL